MTSETLNYKLPLLLHIATVTTGLIDAISYLGLGHVFTANMTGNVVFLAFARNVTVRKMAVPDLTTTVLTLTITGLAADSRFAGGTSPRWRRRLLAVALMFLGAAIGTLLTEAFVGVAVGYRDNRQSAALPYRRAPRSSGSHPLIRQADRSRLLEPWSEFSPRII